MAREKLCLGIDIGASGIKLCQLRRQRDEIALEHFAQRPLPPNAVLDGNIMNPAQVREVLEELLSGLKTKNKQVAFSVSGHSVIIRKITLPQMTTEELEESLPFEAAQFIPFDVNDVYLDGQVLTPESREQGQMDVVLVAAKKDYIRDYTDLLTEVGLEPVVCDVDAFAIETMFLTNYDTSPGNPIALVNIGASKSTLNILNGSISAFTRDLGIGGSAFTEVIRKHMGVSFEEAEQMKLSDSGGISTGAPDQEQTDAVMSHDVLEAMENVANEIADQLNRSMEFYGATSPDPRPSHIYLGGGCASLKLLERTIINRLGIGVTVVDPFNRIGLGGHDNHTRLAAIAPAASVVVGLALRFPGDC